MLENLKIKLTPGTRYVSPVVLSQSRSVVLTPSRSSVCCPNKGHQLRHIKVISCDVPSRWSVLLYQGHQLCCLINVISCVISRSSVELSPSWSSVVFPHEGQQLWCQPSGLAVVMSSFRGSSCDVPFHGQKLWCSPSWPGHQLWCPPSGS